MTPNFANPDDRARLIDEDWDALTTFMLQHAGQYQEESPCARIVTTPTATRLRVTTRPHPTTAPPLPRTRSPRSASSRASSGGRSGISLLAEGGSWLVAFALLAGFVLAAERFGGA